MPHAVKGSLPLFYLLIIAFLPFADLMRLFIFTSSRNDLSA